MKVYVCASPFGHLIGELVNETEDQIHLTYPGQIQVQQTQQGAQFVITEIIPPFIDNQKELKKTFLLQKNNLLFVGQADHQMSTYYKKYQTEQQRKDSGIQIVGKDVLDKLRGKHREN